MLTGDKGVLWLRGVQRATPADRKSNASAPQHQFHPGRSPIGALPGSSMRPRWNLTADRLTSWAPAG